MRDKSRFWDGAAAYGAVPITAWRSTPPARSVNQPEVMITQAPNKFDKDGRLTDEPTRKFIADLLLSLADWTRRLKR